MSKRHKIMNKIVAILLCMLLFPLNILGEMSPILGGHLINGVSNVTIYLNYASGVGYWETYITSAANNWMYTGWDNPIYIQFVSSNYGSTIDFYSKNDSYWSNWISPPLAETVLFDSNSNAITNPRSGVNWLYAEIYINDDAFSSSSFTDAQAGGTVRHEMGHAFGLDENNSNVYSIMCQTGAGRVVQTVQQIDNNSIVYLYN